MLFDSHCHLDAHEFDADRDAVEAAARATGVGRMLVPAVERGNFTAVQDCCRRYAGCLPAYGIHPLYVQTAAEEDLAFLRQWLRDEAAGEHPPVAVGEIGLDHYRADTDAGLQASWFGEQLKIAADAGLPVVLHVRRAVDQVLKHLRRTPVCGGIAHAFNGSRQQADAFLAIGFCLGFGGAMTYPGSARIRHLAATLPLESIVLETDAPDIPPAWLRNSLEQARNKPSELFRVAQVLAELRSLPADEIIAATTDNALRCLRLRPVCG